MMKPVKYGRCDVCGKFVRTRRDDGKLWVHSLPGGPAFRRWWRRCRGEGFTPTEVVEVETRRLDLVVMPDWMEAKLKGKESEDEPVSGDV